MKKKLIITLLVLGLGRTQASTTQVVFCVGIGILAVAAIRSVMIFAKRCETHKYCWKNPEDGGQYCRTMTQGMADHLGKNQIISGPFDSMGACNIACSQMPTNGVSGASELYPPGDDLPQAVTLERTFDGRIWTPLTTVDLDPSADEQFVYADSAYEQVAFYRFRYDAP